MSAPICSLRTWGDKGGSAVEGDHLERRGYLGVDVADAMEIEHSQGKGGKGAEEGPDPRRFGITCAAI